MVHQTIENLDVWNWFKKNSAAPAPLLVDLHSHLLPGLDDGVHDFEQALSFAAMFQQMGYQKIITTPHIHREMFDNNEEKIMQSLDILRNHLKDGNYTLEVHAAAEYYLDDELINRLEERSRLLTFGQRYLLFETNFLNEPLFLKEFVFQAQTKGYVPVLAHPERYLYIQQDLSLAQDLLDRGVYFQINISSFTGYYSKIVQTTAEKLIERGWVHFLGSDAHHLQHMQALEKARKLRSWQRMLALPLLNNSLL